MRPKFEHCIQETSSWVKKTVSFWKRFWEQQLSWFPEWRSSRMMLDVITVFKLRSEKCVSDMLSFLLSFKTENLRGQSTNVHKPRTNKLSADYRISNRVINEWNTFLRHVFKALFIDCLKRKLDHLWTIIARTNLLYLLTYAHYS